MSFTYTTSDFILNSPNDSIFSITSGVGFGPGVISKIGVDVGSNIGSRQKEKPYGSSIHSIQQVLVSWSNRAFKLKAESLTTTSLETLKS